MSNKGQVIMRVSAVLKAIERAGHEGARLRDLSEETKIARPSVHRLLQELIQVGYVQSVGSHRYQLGSELYALGLAAPSPMFDLFTMEKMLKELANVTGDTVYLGVQQQHFVRYLLRVEGYYPVRAQIVEIGQIVPLANTFSGIALMTNYSESEIPHFAAQTLPPFANSSMLPDQRIQALKEQYEQLRRDGYCYSRDLVWPGVAGLASVVPVRVGKPCLAVSISAISDRLPLERAQQLAPHLLRTVEQISELAYV
ncbi:IclR family transcriptional regulator [Serratia ureilytica]|uniref:IclR family transcriptional regulator n=1 Tax=Serratia ureilytica TaxID=300181 RepID=UPI00326576FA